MEPRYFLKNICSINKISVEYIIKLLVLFDINGFGISMNDLLHWREVQLIISNEHTKHDFEMKYLYHSWIIN
jgi:hypothetical protein